MVCLAGMKALMLPTVFAVFLGAPLAASAQVCPQQKLEAARFTPGEALEFKLDALGAEVGSFDLHVELPPASDRLRAALLVRSRAKTSAFVSTNVKRFDAYASVLLGRDLAPLRYKEDVDEGDLHKAQEIDFPPAGGALAVRATKGGEPDPFQVEAGPAVRDILSTLYLLRAQPMKPGQPVCIEVFAGRKVWRLQGQVAARETIDTPLGKFATLRVDAEATLANDGRVKRGAHIWVTDDARRLPLVAIAEIRGRVIRAQLVSAVGGGRKVSEQGPRHIGR